jgi:tRNA pseudouridine38-40 synthase
VQPLPAGRTDTASTRPVKWPTPTSRPMRWSTLIPARGDPEFLPLLRRLARFLPPDVRVLGISRAPTGFDAQVSALRHHYVYRLSTAPYDVEPQQARYVTAWPRAVDIEAMAATSRNMLGLHDFAAFCPARDGATTIGDLQRFEWTRDGDLITAYVIADTFCWSMVRSLVGALLAVGDGRRAPDWCIALPAVTRQSSDFAVAPAGGVTLVGVDNPPNDQLAARTMVNRDLRTRDLGALLAVGEHQRESAWCGSVDVRPTLQRLRTCASTDA